MNDQELEESFRALAKESRHQLDEAPSRSCLLAYGHGELSEEEAQPIRERLASDPATLDRLLDLTAHVPDPNGPDHLRDEDLDEDWETIQRRLRRIDPEDVPRPTAKVLSFPVSGWRQVERLVALAAVLAVAILGFRLWSLGQRLEAPRVNQKSYALLPDGTRGPGDKPGSRISLERDVHLSLAVYDLRDFDAYRLEVHKVPVPEGSEPLWTTEEIVPTDDDTFEIGFAPSFFPPGEYLLRIYGIEDGQKRDVATYSVRF